MKTRTITIVSVLICLLFLCNCKEEEEVYELFPSSTGHDENRRSWPLEVSGYIYDSNGNPVIDVTIDHWQDDHWRTDSTGYFYLNTINFGIEDNVTWPINEQFHVKYPGFDFLVIVPVDSGSLVVIVDTIILNYNLWQEGPK